MVRPRQEVIAGLGTALQRYQRAVQAFDDAVGRRLGLGPADLRCLDWLTDGPLTAGELAVAAGLRPAATTALLDRLSERDFVRRVPSPTDRRRVLVELTEHGRDRVEEAYRPLVEQGPALFESISVQQLETMRELLDAMTALTDEHRERLATDGPPTGSTRPGRRPGQDAPAV